MVSACEILETRDALPLAEAFARDVENGLARTPKAIPSSYFYDRRGSRLFQQITEQPEYYLTACEREILERHAQDIAALVGPGPLRVIELGAGDGHKTEILLRALLTGGVDFEYVPIDICRQSVVDLVAKLRESLGEAEVRVRGLVADYFDALGRLRSESPARSLVLYLGSSIGNSAEAEALRFLRRLRPGLSAGDLALVGFDLKKDPAVIHRAYDDAAGVTRAFNFNLLERINRELGGEFNLDRFVHHPYYNVPAGCMESWLVSTIDQQVPIRALQRTCTLRAWEGIKVEASYKYDLRQIDSLATSAGFHPCQNFFDRRQYFVDSLWSCS